jgi:hypothetical protein
MDHTRNPLRLIAALLLLLLAAGCDRAAAPAAAPSPAEANASAAPAPASTAMLGLAPSQAQVAPPTPGAVLAAIYGEAGDSSAEYELADGRTATFWAGHAYRIGGQERYTAFAYTAPPNETGFAAPGQQVTLAQLTYTLDNGRWNAGAAQADVGVFGGAGRGPEFDADRKPETYAVSAERALLALPSRYFATGISLYAYQLFAHDGQDGRWRYLGQVDSGEDASASCSNGPSTPAIECVRNTGTLRFVPAGADAMPKIEIALVGSVRGDNGAIRLVGAADVKRYVFNTDAGAYAPTTAP